MSKLRIELGERSYDITVERGALNRVGELMNLDRKIFILTDEGVPREYSDAVRAAAKSATVYTVKQGERSKSLSTLEEVLQAMLSFGMSRKDAVVAVGGGVVGDLAGFAAASYMRGIDFYNVPTTLLSEVDSSIGGKTAVNLGVVKNIVGAFHQPRAVVIDTDTLKTLPPRQLAAGMCEAIKMSLTSDARLFEIFEQGDIECELENIILRALTVKKNVVEKDERESGLRKILNFGHTFGHGIEAASGLYHGECVALGMIPMCAPDVRARLLPVLKKLGLPTHYDGDIDEALNFVIHDKKCFDGYVDVIFVEKIGEYLIRKTSVEEFARLVKEGA